MRSQILFANVKSTGMEGILIFKTTHEKINIFNYFFFMYCWYQSLKTESLKQYLQWTSAPPSSCSVTISPVAAFTKGGPARNITPEFFTIIASSAIVGQYAPPAVQLPHTNAICLKEIYLNF